MTHTDGQEPICPCEGRASRRASRCVVPPCDALAKGWVRFAGVVPEEALAVLVRCEKQLREQRESRLSIEGEDDARPLVSSGAGSLRRRLLRRCGSRGMEAVGRLEILDLDVGSCPCYRCRRCRRSLTWGCARARAGGSDPSTMAQDRAGMEGQVLCGPRGGLGGRAVATPLAAAKAGYLRAHGGACAPARRAAVNECLLRSAPAR